jgi:NAD(P)H-hydrate epimerase
MKFFAKNNVATANEMREIDRRTIEELGIAGDLLMESAGKGAFEYIMEAMPGLAKAVVFCGKGNNGGDGFVIARHLLNSSVEVIVYLLGRQKDLKGDAKTNLDRFLKLKGEVIEIASEDQLDEELIPADAELIVDAIFGTGLESEVSGVPQKAIELINDFADQSGANIFAVDIPSGVNASNGQIMGAAVFADATATFGLAKVGHYAYPGANHAGELRILDIGIPDSLADRIKTKAVTAIQAFALLKPRSPDSHKGDNGHALIFAGSPGKTGAAVMAGESALRAGAGLVTLAVPASLNDIFEIKTTEVMTEPIPDAKTRSFDEKSVEAGLAAMQDKDVIAIGPGMGLHNGVDEFFKKIVLASTVPIVIDADGLNSLATQIDILKKAQAPVILTPHPGEMSRLSGLDASEIQWDRVGTAKRFAQEWNVILVLKGAHTVIASPSGEAFINLTGNSGMASAGMGDALTGIITGLLSQGYEPFNAAALGAYIHGKAGDLALKEMGGIGIIATDLIRKIPAVQQSIREEVFGTEE